MPFPALLLWGAAAAVAAVGVKKGVDAYNDFDKAKEIGRKAERKYDRAKDSLNNARENTKRELVELGEIKVGVFKNQIKHVVDVTNARARLANQGKSYSKLSIKDGFTKDELKQCEKIIAELDMADAGSGIVAGLGTGALLSVGAYGAVASGAIGAVASTGAAIGGLSGAAATNATLAWLGGGALSAGGFGVAGGMVALGGIVAAPVLAIGGFIMASKAEEAVSDARAYRAEVDKAVADMEFMQSNLSAIVSAKDELANTIRELVNRFEACKVDEYASDLDFQKMIMLGKALKKAIDVSIMDDKGKAAELDVVCDELLEYYGNPDSNRAIGYN